MAEQESRVKKTLLNARVNLIFYFLTLLLSFFSRKIFLDNLGADFLGLTGTLGNILGYLNLAELGIGSAIGYLLYQPLFDHNEEKICDIISVLGYLYRSIGLFILGAGILISLFLPWIFPDRTTGFSLPLIYFAYYSFLTSSLIGYFLNYKSTLLGADQKNYVIAGYFQTGNIIKTLLQMALAYYTQSYYLWLAIELTFGVIYSVILNWKINQTYPWLKTRIKEGKSLLKQYPDVIIKTKQLFLHKIAASITLQSYNIIIYAVASLSAVTLFGNYTTILGKITSLISTALGSSGASVGNLAAQGNTEYTRRVYWEMAALTSYIGGIVLFGMVEFSNPFIDIWLGSKYELALWIMMPFFIKIYCDYTTSNLGTFLYAHGLFYDVWAPFVEAIICLAVSVTAGIYWGLFGVLLGSMTSNLIINVGWKSYFLFTKGLRLGWHRFWFFYLKYVCIQVGAIVLIHFYVKDYFLKPGDTFLSLGISAIILTLIYTVSTFIVLYLTDKGLRYFTQRTVKLLLRKK